MHVYLYPYLSFFMAFSYLQSVIIYGDWLCQLEKGSENKGHKSVVNKGISFFLGFQLWDTCGHIYKWQSVALLNKA